MKSCEEMTKSLLDRRQAYVAKKRQTKKRLITVGTSVCVAAFAVLLGLGMGKEQPSYEISNPPSVLGNNTDIQEHTTGDTQTEVQTPDRISVNQLDAMPTQEDMYIALHRDDFVTLSEQEMLEYYGILVKPIVPEDLKPVFGSFGPDGIYRRNGGTGEVYHDAQEYSYVNPEDYCRCLGIRYAKERLPYTCCIIPSDTYQASQIGGEEIYIGQFEDIYIAEFFYKDVGFRVASDGLSQEEFVAVLASIIK